MTLPTGTRILIVEDEEALAGGLVYNLERKVRCQSRRDGRRRAEWAAARRYGLMILDIRLPEIDGFQVCQKLRADGNFTPILMLTAQASRTTSSTA